MCSTSYNTTDLRDSYNRISESYQEKKREPWHEILNEIPELKENYGGTLLCAGGGNGRNLKFVGRTMVICLDLAENLLRNYIGSKSDQLILGSIDHLPLRSRSSEEIYCIAVIHHLSDSQTRSQAINEFYRVNSINGLANVTVWRKWRTPHKETLIARIRDKQPIQDLVDHHRPWKDSKGNVLGFRFYHYYTWKEFIGQIRSTKFVIKKRKIMGGRYKDENFLVRLLKS